MSTVHPPIFPLDSWVFLPCFSLLFIRCVHSKMTDKFVSYPTGRVAEVSQSSQDMAGALGGLNISASKSFLPMSSIPGDVFRLRCQITYIHSLLSLDPFLYSSNQSCK